MKLNKTVSKKLKLNNPINYNNFKLSNTENDCQEYHFFVENDYTVKDKEILDMEEIFNTEFESTDNWKDFVYTLLDYGYEDIPSKKMVEFVNNNFDNTHITTNNIGAIRAAWIRSL